MKKRKREREEEKYERMLALDESVIKNGYLKSKPKNLTWFY